jgi:hypothetical protein
MYTGVSMTDQNGHFFQGVGVDLVPGMAVEVNDCLDTRSVTLVPITIDVIDPEGDIVSGTAPSGAKIFVVPGREVYKTVTADRNGLWRASFAGKFDITNKTTVQATAQDENENGTTLKIGVTLEPKPTPLPSQTPELTSTFTPTVTITPIPILSPTLGQPVGVRISLSNANQDPHIEFPAGVPFYIQHGWTDSPDPLQLGFGYKLEVDSALRKEDYILMTVGDNQQITRAWTYIFPNGLKGRHVFTGYHLALCQWAMNFNPSFSCPTPTETVVYGIHKLIVNFIP